MPVVAAEAVHAARRPGQDRGSWYHRALGNSRRVSERSPFGLRTTLAYRDLGAFLVCSATDCRTETSSKVAHQRASVKLSTHSSRRRSRPLKWLVQRLVRDGLGCTARLRHTENTLMLLTFSATFSWCRYKDQEGLGQGSNTLIHFPHHQIWGRPISLIRLIN